LLKNQKHFVLNVFNSKFIKVLIKCTNAVGQHILSYVGIKSSENEDDYESEDDGEGEDDEESEDEENSDFGMGMHTCLHHGVS
jgi:hypothetical protein